jgi:uncharacterized protein with HEPN domain
MRREQVYLADMLEACDDLADFVCDTGYEGFLTDKLRQSAVMQKLMVIGEAAARVSEEFRQAHPEIEWAAIAGLRNRIVHGYFNIDWDIVWKAATAEAPALRSQVASILGVDKP